MRKLFVGCAAIATLVAAGCLPDPPDKYRSFFALPMGQDSDSLLTYPVEDQVDIYVWAMTERHPPRMHLADALAKNGLTLVMPVREKLSQAKDEPTQFALIYALESLACASHDLRRDKPLIAQIETVVQQMDAGYWKDRGGEALRRIQGELSCGLTEEEMRKQIGQLRARLDSHRK
jgi:hypothetical protein